MGVVLHLLEPDGRTEICLLPDYESIRATEEFCDVGGIEVTYPRNGTNADLLLEQDDALLRLVVDGVPDPQLYLLEDDGDDPTDAQRAGRLVRVGGRGVLGVFDRARVYPHAHVPGRSLVNLEPWHTFVNATPAAIMNELIKRAQARGVQFPLTPGFPDQVDSAGRPWPRAFTVEFTPQDDYLTVLRRMHESGWVEFRARAERLEFFVPGTAMQRDLPVVIAAGREVSSSPRARSRRGILSALLSVGDEGAIVERERPGTASRYGRREGYDGRGGVTALDSLTALADTILARQQDKREGFTVSYSAAGNAPQPYRDYRVGDYIRYDARRGSRDRTMEPLRVLSISRAFDSTGARTVEVEFNDVFLEQDIRLARKVNAILGGSSSNSRPPRLPSANDAVRPMAPEVVTVSSGTNMGDDGQHHSYALVSWSKVSRNVDGSAYDDFGRYEVRYWLRSAGAWTAWAAAVGDSTQHVVEGLRPNLRFQAEVRTVDASGNASAATASPVVLIEGDLDPPEVPSRPNVEGILHGLRVTWDGRGESGAPLAPDLLHVEVHVSKDGASFTPTTPARRTAPGFDPATDTLRDALPAAGVSPIVDVPPETTLWVRLVAVDVVGNRSEPSEAGEGTAEGVVSKELQDWIIERGQVGFQIGGGNLLANGSFERDDVSAFEFFGARSPGRVTVPDGVHGVVALQLGAYGLTSYSGVMQTVQVLRGEPYVASVWVRRTSGSEAYLNLLWLGTGGTLLRQDRVTTTGSEPVGSWFRMVIVADSPPSGALSVRVGLAGRALIAGNTVRVQWDGWQLELGDVPTAFSLAPGELLPGSVGPTEIRDDSITTPKIVAGAVVAYQIAAKNIGAEHMAAGSITAGNAALADAVVVNAKIANLAVDDAKIGNMSVTKLTAGLLRADVTLSGRIMTARTGNRVDISPIGIRVFRDGVIAPQVFLRADGLASTFRGEILAEVFRTRAYSFSGNYIEMGAVFGDPDPGDEVRLVTGGSAVNFRNSPARPGALMISTRPSSSASPVRYVLSQEMGWELPSGYNVQSPTTAVNFGRQQLNFRFTNPGATAFSSRDGGTRLHLQWPVGNGVGLSASLVFAAEFASLKAFSGRLEARTDNDVGWGRFAAAGFDQESDPRAKWNIRDIDSQDRDRVRALRARAYEVAGGRTRIGYSADDLPDVVVSRAAESSSRTKTIDLYGTLSLLIDALREDVNELRAAIADGRPEPPAPRPSAGGAD